MLRELRLLMRNEIRLVATYFVKAYKDIYDLISIEMGLGIASLSY